MFCTQAERNIVRKLTKPDFEKESLFPRKGGKLQFFSVFRDFMDILNFYTKVKY